MVSAAEKMQSRQGDSILELSYIDRFPVPMRVEECQPQPPDRSLHVLLLLLRDHPDSEVATAAGSIRAYPDGGDPGTEAAGGLPPLHAKESQPIFRSGI